MKYGTYYLVRKIGGTEFEKGTGNYAVPKLYLKGSATALKNRRNKEGRGEYEIVPIDLVDMQPAQKAKPIIPQPFNDEEIAAHQARYLRNIWNDEQQKRKPLRKTLAELLGIS